MPRVHQLRTYDLPDIGDHLIHFTGAPAGALGGSPVAVSEVVHVEVEVAAGFAVVLSEPVVLRQILADNTQPSCIETIHQPTG